ncbi:hypothetical protein DEU56DRAFT_981524 [Suillus clintonianus]|uniref:uncharacterized protein n=1 Tax=Suillus clintonianus TaxID=1904413 RepID=UPI001B87B7D5|nr:uncharacterized protein DEU56DRAFT_981524 [Suillus clintonianus]KAG2133284.1 hypothetical protein DEU56DRAFT_981524 [Suillus clintonianus]
MPTWLIFSPNEEHHVHPMQMNVFRVMKTAYHMLYPSHEPSTIDEVSRQPLTIGYASSEENTGPPDLSSLVIHVNRFSVVFRDMQIKDKWPGRDVCVPVPSELMPVIMDIYEFALARSDVGSRQWDTMTESYFARRIWKQLQVERYHQRVLQQQLPGGTDSRLPPAFWKCSLCSSDLIHCDSCQVTSCGSRDCRGSSEPPLARCITHPKEVLCLTCLKHQGTKLLDKCPACKLWCCAKDMASCTGRPVGIESNHYLRGRQSTIRLMMAYGSYEGAHPPKPECCLECELPDWRTCSNSPFCWSKRICPECATNGVMCLCERLWACDLCADRADVFIRCPRCNQPFCTSCSYIDKCDKCHRVSLCNDCIEEAADADEAKPVEVAPCESCVKGVRRIRGFGTYRWRRRRRR